MLAGQSDVHKGEILAQLLKHGRHRVLVVIPAQTEILMSSNRCHFVWFFVFVSRRILAEFLLLTFVYACGVLNTLRKCVYTPVYCGKSRRKSSI